jgi:hypothetical protein
MRRVLTTHTVLMVQQRTTTCDRGGQYSAPVEMCWVNRTLSLKESRRSKWLDVRERANTEVLRFPPNVLLLFCFFTAVEGADTFKLSPICHTT